MGETVRPGLAPADELEARQRLERSITALALMVEGGAFDTEADTCGLEVELDLVDPLGRPRHVPG